MPAAHFGLATAHRPRLPPIRVRPTAHFVPVTSPPPMERAVHRLRIPAPFHSVSKRLEARDPGTAIFTTPPLSVSRGVATGPAISGRKLLQTRRAAKSHPRSPRVFSPDNSRPR